MQARLILFVYITISLTSKQRTEKEIINNSFTKLSGEYLGQILLKSITMFFVHEIVSTGKYVKVIAMMSTRGNFIFVFQLWTTT